MVMPYRELLPCDWFDGMRGALGAGDAAARIGNLTVEPFRFTVKCSHHPLIERLLLWRVGVGHVGFSAGKNSRRHVHMWIGVQAVGIMADKSGDVTRLKLVHQRLECWLCTILQANTPYGSVHTALLSVVLS